jgi:hypothetical protein
MTTAQEETCSSETVRKRVDVSLGDCGVVIIILPLKQLNLEV